MRITKEKDHYRVGSEANKRVFYIVDPKKKTCTCAQYRFRAKKTGEICKHIVAITEHLKNLNKNEEKELLEVVKKLGPIDFAKLAESYSEDLINDLIKRGELIEDRGKIELLK